MSAASWANDVDSTAYSVLTSVAGTNTITATGPANYSYVAARTPVLFIPAATTTGATTINITPSGGAALGAKAILWKNSALGAGALTIAVPVLIVYDGASFQIVANGFSAFGEVVKRKTADESVTSSTVLQDDDHLTFAIAANEEWVVTFNIYAGSGLTTTGLKVAVTTPAGSELRGSGHAPNISISLGQNVQFTASGASAGIWAAADWPVNVAAVTIDMWVLNGATPGNVTLQFAQNTSSGTPVTLLKGSFMVADRIA